jgi:hypothetical protein
MSLNFESVVEFGEKFDLSLLSNKRYKNNPKKIHTLGKYLSVTSDGRSI